MSDNNYKSVIFKLEDTDLLMGRISFALYCCSQNFQVSELIEIADIISTYFEKDKEVSPLLRRAILTIEIDGKYEYYTYWWSYWNVGQSHKRCLIDKFRVIEYCIDSHSECREYFKKLIIQLKSVGSLEAVIDSFIPPADMPNWKIRLIKEPALLSSKFSNYIAIPDDNSCCYLLKSKRPRTIEGNQKIE